MADSRETFRDKAFVIGHPIKHSRSPLIHRYWLREFKIDGDYVALDISPENIARFIADLKSRESGYRGGNVTIPHKESVFALVDRVDEIANELGAANTLYIADGGLHATNTDSYGFLANLDSSEPGWDRKRDIAVVYGAGGASRAVIQSLRDRGFREIHVLNRTVARAEELSCRFGAKVHAGPLSALDERLYGADIFVNTSSLGMDQQIEVEIDFSKMANGALVTDIVYVPLVTPFLLRARSQGIKTVDGLGMLLHQAVPGFEKWFGREPEVTPALRNLIIDDLEKH